MDSTIIKPLSFLIIQQLNDFTSKSSFIIYVVALLIVFGYMFKCFLSDHFQKLPPGPIGIPFFGYLLFLGKEPHKTLAKLGKKYGPVFR